MKGTRLALLAVLSLVAIFPSCNRPKKIHVLSTTIEPKVQGARIDENIIGYKRQVQEARGRLGISEQFISEEQFKFSNAAGVNRSNRPAT